jgi:4-carboxymuconolactone decarboxylase
MGRLHLPAVEEFTPEQKKVYDDVVSGPRGRMVGPLRAIIHSPELATRWSQVGVFLRYKTSLPPKLNELAVIIAGRYWNSQLEFQVHAEAARVAGLDPTIIEAIRLGRAPEWMDEAEQEIYEFSRLLLQTGNISDALHAAITRRWGERGCVELTAVIGYYTMVSFTLNAHEIPLLDGAPPPLPVSGSGPTLLPAAGQSK